MRMGDGRCAWSGLLRIEVQRVLYVPGTFTSKLFATTRPFMSSPPGARAPSRVKVTDLCSVRGNVYRSL